MIFLRFFKILVFFLPFKKKKKKMRILPVSLYSVSSVSSVKEREVWEKEDKMAPEEFDLDHYFR